MGDDFLSEGPGDNLKAMDTEMRRSFALKTEILGGDHGDVQSLAVLNRQISWKDGAIHWEADPRHVEILAKHLGASSLRMFGHVHRAMCSDGCQFEVLEKHVCA